MTKCLSVKYLKKSRIENVNSTKIDTSLTQPTFTSSKLTIRTLEQDVKYAQS